MTKRELIPLTSYDDIPPDMTEAEARDFWDTHEITEEFLASAPPVPDDDLPPARPSKYVAIYLNREAFGRARLLARRRGLRVADLFDVLVEEALAAEEERARASGS